MIRIIESFTHSRLDDPRVNHMNSSPLAHSPVEDIADVTESYGHHVNPAWARLVNILGMNLRYTRCSGVELETTNEPHDSRLPLRLLRSQCRTQSSVHRPGAGARTPIERSLHVAEQYRGERRRVGGGIVQESGGKGHRGFLLQLRKRGDRSCHQILPRLYWTHRDCLRDRSLSRLDLRRTLVDGR